MRRRIPAAWLFAALTGLCLAPAVVRAADNVATGDIAGVDADLGNSNTFTLNTSTLTLVKTAFLANGTPIASGATLPRGTIVKFMIYVDNPTAFAADSVNVQDVLAAAFAYQANSIKVDASANTGATPAAIFTAVDAVAALTDAVSGADVAGYSGSTVSAGNGGGNAIITVPANKVWAMSFTVKMQ